MIVPVNLPDPTETPLPADVPTATATPIPPTDTPVPPTATPTPTATATPVTYTVQGGDTLGNIATRFGTTVEELSQLNNIQNVHQIDVGQVLLIPTPEPPTPTPPPPPTATPQADTTSQPAGSVTTYTVQAGDTLDEIATQFNTTVGAIALLNGITNPSRIFPGQVLQVPVPGGSSSGQQQQQEQVDPTATPIPTPTPIPTAVPTAYTVQTGDTLFQIAARFGVSVVELAAINYIIDYNQISVGQVLTIPG